MRFLVLLLLTTSAFAQRSQTISADCLKIGATGDCITQAEFNTLDGVTSDIQIQLNAKGAATDITALDTRLDAAEITIVNHEGRIVALEAEATIEQYATLAAFPVTGVTGTLYLAQNTNFLFRWNGSAYVQVGGGGVVDLSTAAVSGILPLARGGTNKNATANNGAIAYSDADSFELLAPGTAGQVLQTNGASAPSFANKSISGKDQNSSAITLEEIQVPNRHLTPIDTGKYLVETGNSNILRDPSFESSGLAAAWNIPNGSINYASTAINGLVSAQLTLTAQSLVVTQSPTLYASQFADGVQGLASMRVKIPTSLTTPIYVCSIQNGTEGAAGSGCVQVQNNNKWGLYKVPFILGGTSNGIALTSKGVAFTNSVEFDDAFVGAVDLKVDGTTITTQTSLNSTTSVGAGVVIAGSQDATYTTGTGLFTYSAGTYTAQKDIHAVITVVTQNSTTATTQPAIYINGAAVSSANTAASTSLQITATWSGRIARGVAFSGRNDASTASNARVIVSAYEIINSSSYSASCGANCVDTFSFRGNSGAQVTSENVDFISGNGATSTSGNNSRATYTFNTSIFTVAPACVVSPNADAAGGAQNTCSVQTTTSTSVVVSCTSQDGTTETAALADHFVICQKQGADFTATRTIVGSFNEVVTAPGISKPKICYYAFGGASATLASPTECTTGTCTEVVDSCGTGSPPTYSAPSLYQNLTFASGTFAISTPVKCDCVAYDTTAVTGRECIGYFDTGDNTWGSNASGGYVANMSVYSSVGGANDAYVQIQCEGQAP